MADLTPFQTVGPFFALLPLAGEESAAAPGAPGRSIRIEGIVRDGAGAVVPDALIETWQADAAGRFDAADPTFRGFARAVTDDSGRYHIRTVMPGPVEGPEGTTQAPHVLVSILARGILTRLVTRIYFAGEPANPADPILSLVPKARRATLLASALASEPYRFDIVLQGPGETVFFDV